MVAPAGCFEIDPLSRYHHVNTLFASQAVLAVPLLRKKCIKKSAAQIEAKLRMLRLILYTHMNNMWHHDTM